MSFKNSQGEKFETGKITGDILSYENRAARGICVFNGKLKRK